MLLKAAVRTTKKVAGHIINIRADKWIGVDYLTSITKDNLAWAKVIFTPKKTEREETFEQALARLNLTEADIIDRKHEFTRLFNLFATLSLILLTYGIYLAFQGNYMGFAMCFGLTIFSIGQSFRYHFWLFQIKQRKLGCTFQEWFNGKI